MSNNLLIHIPENMRDRISVTEEGFVRCGETATHYIDVLPMLFNDRIVTTNKSMPSTYDRYWCYRKGGAALIAALAWDGSEDTEPVGWKKSWDQRYQPEND